MFLLVSIKNGKSLACGLFVGVEMAMTKLYCDPHYQFRNQKMMDDADDELLNYYAPSF